VCVFFQVCCSVWVFWSFCVCDLCVGVIYCHLCFLASSVYSIISSFFGLKTPDDG
jgi:hypothetical protein